MSEPGETQSVVPEIGPALGQQGTAGPVSDGTTGPASAPDANLKKGRSRLVAVLLSFLWPGLGQFYARKRIMAAVFGIPVVLAIVWLAIQAANGVDWFALSLLDSSFAATLAIGAAVLGIWRLAAMVHAYATAGPLRRPRAVEGGVLAILLVVVVAVHAEAAYYAWSFYQFDVDVASNIIVDSSPITTPSPVPTAAPTPTPLDWQPAGSYAPPNPTPEVTPEPAASHRVTIMLAGLDWLPGRTGGQYDALMLISLDTDTNKVAMVSMPRDTANFDYYWGGQAGINTKINNFANLVDRRQIKAPDPKFTALANELGFLVGVKVDYYAVIDMAGFTSLVDVAGGVCVYNPKAIFDPSQKTYIAAGNVCLNGTNALKYARSRHNGGSDYVRAARQQALIAALAKKIASPSGIGRLPKLLSLSAKIVQTNFPLNTAKNYASIIRQIGSGNITQCVLGPPYDYHPATALTKGAWTSRLKLYMVASLSVDLFGADSRYYGMEGISPAPCAS
jgi:LCP family protein required for cell wall assembly